MNLSDARKQFIKHLEDAGRAGATLVAYGKDIDQLVDFASKKGKSTANEIVLEDLQDFMTHFLEKGFTAKTISRKTNSVKTFFGFLKEKDFIDTNVSEYLKHPKIKVSEPRILSQMEYRALRDVTRNDLRSYALIEVFLQTGLSIAEVAGMELSHLHMDSDNPYIYIPARDSKGERTVPMNEVAVRALKEYLEKDRFDKESDFVFITRTGNSLLVRNIRSTVNRYFTKAGVENATVNDLRHTFIAHNLKSGASVSYISKIVGHKRVSTTERYLEFIGVKESGQRAELTVL